MCVHANWNRGLSKVNYKKQRIIHEVHISLFCISHQNIRSIFYEQFSVQMLPCKGISKKAEPNLIFAITNKIATEYFYNMQIMPNAIHWMKCTLRVNTSHCRFGLYVLFIFGLSSCGFQWAQAMNGPFKLSQTQINGQTLNFKNVMKRSVDLEHKKWKTIGNNAYRNIQLKRDGHCVCGKFFLLLQNCRFQ